MRYLKDTAVKFTIVALALAALGAGVALASGEDDPDKTPTGQAARDTRSAEREAARQQFLAGVAERLGVSVAELETAIKDETLEQVDQAAKDGKLSVEQARRLRQAVEEGKAYGPFGQRFGRHFGQRFDKHLGPPFHGPGAAGPERQAGPGQREGHARPGNLRHFEALRAAAQYLGLEPAELVRELSAGQSLADLAAAQGKSISGLKEALLETAEARLDEAAKKLAALGPRLESLIEQGQERPADAQD